MPHEGKVSYPDARAEPGKMTFQGGGSRGKSAKFKAGTATPMIKTHGKPRDKGVNR